MKTTKILLLNTLPSFLDLFALESNKAVRHPKLTISVLASFYFLVLACAPALGAPIMLPAITEPASQEHHVGKVIFMELVTPDIVAMEKFYGDLLGWTYREVSPGGPVYVEAFLNDHPVAGLIERNLPANEQKQPAWLSFFAVTDVDAAKQIAIQNGAKILYEPASLPHRGREAILADPEGAIFAVLASSSGDPPNNLADDGEWIWSSLITINPDNDAAFYQKIFNYEVFELPSTHGTQHLLLASDNYAAASVNTLVANRSNVLPHWLNYIRVQDAVMMATKVEELGGRVIVQPRTDRHGGKVAVVADPLGAPFGLLEWPEQDSKLAPN